MNWNELVAGALIGVAAGIVAGLAVVLLAVLQPRRYCPECGIPLPKVGGKARRPGWSGGWICPECGCEIDRKGKKVKQRK